MRSRFDQVDLNQKQRSDVHKQAVRQTVRIVEMDHPQGILRTGDRAKVQFEFISHPEFVKEGMKLLFREGKTKVCHGCLSNTLALRTMIVYDRVLASSPNYYEFRWSESEGD